MPEAAAETTDGPLNPHKGQPEEEEGDEIRNHKSAAAVTSGLNGETQEITEADGASCDS
jgi:hypothetical protein